MASEASRETSVRRFTKPDDDQTYVDMKVIDVISFIDPRESYQESEHTFDNTSQNTSRKAHKVTVTGIDDPSSTIDVERIDSYDTIDDSGSFQEAITSLLNSDDPPTHLQTHTIKVFNADDDSSWIKVQRVGRISVVDKAGQETIFRLDWPDGSNTSDNGSGNIDLDNTENSDYDSNLDEPDKSSDGTDINPPWRLDPFQNIVDVSWGGVMLVLYNGNQVAAIPMGGLSDRTFDPVYTATLRSSSWRISGTVPPTTVCQIKISKGFSPIVASFKVTKAEDVAEASISPRTIDPSTGEVRGWCWNAASFLTTGVACDAPDVMNGGGDTLYTGGFIVTNNKGQVSVTAGVSTDAELYAIDKNGRHYYGIAAGNVSCQAYVIGADTSLASSYDATWTADVAAWDYGPTPGFWGTGALITPGYSFSEPYVAGTETATVASMIPVGAHVRKQIVISGTDYADWLGVPHVTSIEEIETDTISGSFDIYLPMYSGGGIDVMSSASTFSSILSLDDLLYSIPDPDNPSGPIGAHTLSLNFSLSASCAGLDVSASSFSWTGTWGSPYIGWPSDGPTFDPIPSVDLYPWPFGYNGVCYAVYTNADGNSGYIRTPYSQIPFSGSESMMGWLHASNDKHIIQGIAAGTDYADRHLWLDGRPCGAALAAALGTELKQIDAVMFDISLGAIKQLV